MDYSQINTINKFLEKINKTKVCKIGRSCDVIWISFKDKEETEYALHIQSFFRFCDSEKILITDMDKYQPIKALSEVEDYDWDVQGDNLFDEWCDIINQNYSDKTIVEFVNVNQFGDLYIKFSNSLLLSVYIDTTSDDESWRVFTCNNRKDCLIAKGNGIQSVEG